MIDLLSRINRLYFRTDPDPESIFSTFPAVRDKSFYTLNRITEKVVHDIFGTDLRRGIFLDFGTDSDLDSDIDPGSIFPLSIIER